MKIVYSLHPSSFCFGVEKSIVGLHEILKKHPGEKIFCIHALVHNPKVTKMFEAKGVQFVEDIDEVENKQAIVVFSAHGTDRTIIQKAEKQFEKVYNLECPFVTKIYMEAEHYLSKGIRKFIYIGKKDHQEGKNVIAYIQSKGAKVSVIQNREDMPKFDADEEFAVLSQTTLNFDTIQKILQEIKHEYPNAKIPSSGDVCKATFERQSVILQNLEKIETFVVIGGKESNNTKELFEIGKKNNKQTFYGESLDDILQYPHDDLLAKETVAVTGGASTPREDIQEVVDFFVGNGYKEAVLTLE